MRLDTEYYTHAKQEATNWVMCLYLPVIQLISTMHVDHWGDGWVGEGMKLLRAGLNTLESCGKACVAPRKESRSPY